VFIKNIIASSFTIQDHVGKTSIIFFFSLIMGDNMTNCHKMIEYCISFRVLRRHLPLIFYEKINCQNYTKFRWKQSKFWKFSKSSAKTYSDKIWIQWHPRSHHSSNMLFYPHEGEASYFDRLMDLFIYLVNTFNSCTLPTLLPLCINI
jgi:hypothetical protein